MRRLIIKVCGMRDAGNIRRVEQLAPDWMGFICWEGSRRYVGPTPAYLPRRCSRVGVFVNPDLPTVLQETGRLGLQLIQLHGQETPDFCRGVKEEMERKGHEVRLIKAFSMAPGAPFPDTAAYEPVCDYFLFDTQCAGVGGSGRNFDWTILQQYRGRTPFLLSGGIGPDSVACLRDFSHPRWAGIDVNSRFELSPALKDADSLGLFMGQIRGQDNMEQLNNDKL